MLNLVIFALVLVAVIIVVIDFLTGPPINREVVIHTKKPDDQTVRGVLIRRNRRWIKLEAARYVDGENQIRLEGEVLIPAGNVAFIQTL